MGTAGTGPDPLARHRLPRAGAEELRSLGPRHAPGARLPEQHLRRGGGAEAPRRRRSRA